jgi:SET and MYND domain-containing protein
MVICGTDLFSSIVPYIHILSSSTYCSQCLNSSTDLKRCSKCHIISYCSTSCQRKDWIYHKYECSNLHKITDEYDLTRLFLRLIIRYRNDHGTENAPTKRCVNDLKTHENDIRHDKRRFMIFQSIYQRLKQWNIFDELDETIIFGLFCRLVINTLTIHDPIDLKSIGYGLYLDATIYNHSCIPTCHTVFNGIYLSIRTINEELTDEWTINYIDLL